MLIQRASASPIRLAGITLGIAAATAPAYAAPPSCSVNIPAGARCVATVLELRPTQFALGMRQARAKAEKLRSMSLEKRARYLEDHPAKIVIGPGGRLFLIDRHHLARALAGLRLARMPAETQANWSDAPSAGAFWQRMARAHFVFPFDEQGRGPLPPSRLPTHVLEMRDDPYRSLSAEVRDRGGYDKTDVPFAEFQWAQFFRTRVPLEPGDEGFEKAVRMALKLAGSDEARGLPGSKVEPTFWQSR